MNIIKRLDRYYAFDKQTLKAVQQVATWQNQLSYATLTEQYTTLDGWSIVPGDRYHGSLSILTLQPQGKYNTKHARIYYTPIAAPVDANITMRMLRLFAADPSEQLIVVGNPGILGRPSGGRAKLRGLQRLWKGDLSPVVDPLLSYLQKQGIRTVDHIGFSYGAERATIAAARSAAYGLSVKSAIWMEPVAVVNRTIWQLGKEFNAGRHRLDDYVRAANSKPLFEARHQTDASLLPVLSALLRPSNLALEHALIHGGFESHARAAFNSQPTMRAAIVWGTESELVPNEAVSAIIDRLQADYRSSRICSLPMQGMHHAGGDDIDLHAAMVLQAYRELD